MSDLMSGPEFGVYEMEKWLQEHPGAWMQIWWSKEADAIIGEYQCWLSIADHLVIRSADSITRAFSKALYAARGEGIW